MWNVLVFFGIPPISNWFSSGCFVFSVAAAFQLCIKQGKFMERLKTIQYGQTITNNVVDIHYLCTYCNHRYNCGSRRRYVSYDFYLILEIPHINKDSFKIKIFLARDLTICRLDAYYAAKWKK